MALKIVLTITILAAINFLIARASAVRMVTNNPLLVMRPKLASKEETNTTIYYNLSRWFLYLIGFIDAFIIIWTIL